MVTQPLGRPPNFLFIMADQFRADFMGGAGNRFVSTPNIDRIAAAGIRFTNCFSNAPICSPARIGLATGLLPSRIGSLSNDSFLPLSVPTYYQRLRDHGYRTGCTGKLDLAKPDRYNGRRGDRPCVYAYGFTHPEECEGKMHAGTSPTPQGPYGFWLAEQGLYERFHADYKDREARGWIRACHDSVLPADAFEDSYIGRRAVEWLESIPDDFPFHYFVSFAGPHDPFDPPAEFAAAYRTAAMPPAVRDSLEGKPAWVRRSAAQYDDEFVSLARRQYCGAIAAIDRQVGAILDALERRGLREHTCILFSSDHGEMLGDHGLFTKSFPYEGALRVPLIVAGPGITAGRSNASIVELDDLNPTICELAGLPAQPHIDAWSFASLLRGERATHREEAVSALHGFRCIRTATHKYVLNRNDCPELYDLERDPDELENIDSRDPTLCAALEERMQARFLEGGWLR